MEITHAHDGMRVRPAYSEVEINNSYLSGLTGGHHMPRRRSAGIVKCARHVKAASAPRYYGNVMQVQWDDAYDGTWWYDASLIQPAATGEF